LTSVFVKDQSVLQIILAFRTGCNKGAAHGQAGSARLTRYAPAFNSYVNVKKTCRSTFFHWKEYIYSVIQEGKVFVKILLTVHLDDTRSAFYNNMGSGSFPRSSSF
jgi:hypothetical protein